MHRGFRVWGMALAMYILMVVVLQMTIYIAAPKERVHGCRGGSRTVGFEGKERRYIASYYLKRSGDRFVLTNEDEFIASLGCSAEDPVEVCVADVDWYERVSVFDTFSLFSASDTTRRIESFSAREGSMGEYTAIDPYVYSEMQTVIGLSASDPGFVKAGYFSAVIPKVDPMNFVFKLVVHGCLFWCALLWAPSATKTVRWWILPSPKRSSGCCVNCAYRTAGLTTSICPECGREHGCTFLKGV